MTGDEINEFSWNHPLSCAELRLTLEPKEAISTLVQSGKLPLMEALRLLQQEYNITWLELQQAINKTKND